MTKQYLLYLLRWQLSTPVLAFCLWWLGGLGEFWATVVANLVGAIIMYPVDKFIFSGARKRVRRDKDKR